MFSRAIPSPFCQGRYVTHQEFQSSTLKPRELSAQPLAASPQTLLDRASPHVVHAPVFVSNMEQICHLVRFLRRSETHRVSCPRVSGEHQAQPKGCKVLLIPLAPPIAPETGAHTDTLTNTHSQTYKQNIHTNTTHTLLTHIHVLKYKHSTHIQHT